MKKFILLLGLFLALNSNAKAEVYHGIDIDYVKVSFTCKNASFNRLLVSLAESHLC